MKQPQAFKQAAKQSKSGVTAFVVWVPDEGRAIFDADQVKMYGPLIFIEAAFLGGVQISCETAVAA